MRLSFITLPLILVLLIGLNSGCGGTGTGNPFSGGENASNPTNGAENPPPGATQSNQLITTLCNYVQSCDAGFDAEACHSSLSSSDQIVIHFGLSPASYENFYAVMWDEYQSFLNVDETAHGQCRTSIESLNCSDPLITDMVTVPGGSSLAEEAVSLLSDASTSCGADLYP